MVGFLARILINYCFSINIHNHWRNKTLNSVYIHLNPESEQDLDFVIFFFFWGGGIKYNRESIIIVFLQFNIYDELPKGANKTLLKYF